MERSFTCESLDKDFYNIPELGKSTELDYEIKESKDRDQNKVFELTIVRCGVGVIDTYTYYNDEAMIREIDCLESEMGIEMNGFIPY